MTKKIKIPNDLIDILSSLDICEYKVIEYNYHKGRYCLSTIYKNNQCFLKWNDKLNEHFYFRQSLLKEMETYYYLNKYHLCPPIVLCDKNSEVLMTEFFLSGTTLRQKIKDLNRNKENSKIISIIMKLTDKWTRCISLISQNNNAKDNSANNDYDLFNKYLGSLLCSGPFDSRRNFLEEKRNKIIRKIISHFYKITVFKKKKHISTPANCFYVHGDFHANNIIIRNDECFIIDFENIRKGNPNIELSYLYAQLRLLLRNNKIILDWLDSYIKLMPHSIIDQLEMKFYSDIFNKIIFLNHRFY